MRFVNWSWFLLCLVLLNCRIAVASGPALRFERLTIEDGLTQNSVFAIVQDTRGFMWFGTEVGLNRFDGYRFKHFVHHEQDSSSLSGNFVQTLYQDQKGTLWVGTKSDGLNRFNRQTETFTRFAFEQDNPNSLSHNFVTAIIEDAKGALWVGTWGGGLNRYDSAQGHFEQFKHDSADNNSLSHNNVHTLFKDSQGRLWIGTEGGGLNLFDDSTGRFIHYRHDPQNPESLSHDRVYALFEDRQSSLWIGTFGGGLNRFDEQSQTFERFEQQLNNPNSLIDENVWKITADDDGLLWIGTDGGLSLFNPDKKTFVNYRHQSSGFRSLSHNNIRSIVQDHQGLMWLGTENGGLNKVDPRQRQFGHYKHSAADPDSLGHNQVFYVYEDSTQSLWFGSYGGGLDKTSGMNQPFEHIRHQPNNPNSISDNSVWALLEDKPGQFFIATSGGLDHYDADTGQFKHFRHDNMDPTTLSHDWVIDIEKDRQNRLWVGSYGGGLNRFDRNSQSFVHYSNELSDKNSLSNDYVRSLLSTADDVLWVGTVDGLNRYDPQKNHFVRYVHDKDNPTSLSQNAVLTIFEDRDGVVWFGTAGGLNRYNPATDDFTRYRKKDGMANDTIYCIVDDREGFLWMSTNLGLLRFDSNSGQFKNYDVSDGLQSNEFNANACTRSTTGELFFGGINGFNRFLPQNIRHDSHPPSVVFTDFLLFNQSVAVDPIATPFSDDNFSLPKTINELPLLTLGHKQNLVSFEFAALDFRSPMKNRYLYQLQGLDKNWIQTDANIRRAYYTNLPSGDYTLRIKASNGEGDWNEQGASIKIHVNPPPWRSWWAYLIYLGIFVSTVMWIIHYRHEKDKIRHERMVLNRLKQVDTLKDAFLANTSHELRTPLNGIIGLAESLLDGIAGQLPDKANKNLAMVVTSGRRLSHLINDILDLSKLKHSGIVLNPHPVDLHALTDVVLTLSQPLLAGKKVQLVNAVPQSLTAVMADEDRLLQIIHNLVGNGVKFTDNGTVTISAEPNQNGVTVNVSDTGIGISEDKFDTIFKSFEQVQGDSARSYGGTGLGLTITRQLVELHGGTIEVSSQLGLGTKFTFTLPDSAQGDVSTEKPQAMPHKPALYVEDENRPSADNVVFEQVETVNNGNRFRLLLVDDEPINLQVLHNHLSVQHYQLVEATDGLQALQAIENDGPFDLVLLDIMMPKLSGYEVCKTLRRKYSISQLPVIFLTAKNQVDDLVHGFAVGANDHLSKPVAKHELLSRVAIHLKMLDINRNLDRIVDERTSEIVETQKKLVLSEKLASLGTLMAGVAHEINNPANFVNISVHNLERDLAECQQYIFDLAGEDAEQVVLDGFYNKFNPLHQHIKTIKQGATRINTLVKDLKTSSHMNDADKAEVCITDNLLSTINLVGVNYKQAIEIVTEFEATPTISCYPAKMNQVFMNLLVNACDALEQKPDGKIVVGCRLMDSMVEITVGDNGCGMTQQTKDKLFEPFYTTKGIEKGTGLGLSISYDIVQKHGGELNVESKLNEGTVFRLSLPL